MKTQKHKISKRIFAAIIAALLIILTLFSGCSTGDFKSSVLNDVDESYTYSDLNYVALDGSFTNIKVTDESSAMQAVSDASEYLGLTDVFKELKILDVNSIYGDSYYRMNQYYNDIPVYGQSVTMSVDSSGNIMDLTANVKSISNLSTQPQIDYDEAKETVKKEYNLEDNNIYQSNSNEIYILSVDDDYCLVYRVLARTEDGLYSIFVNAENSQIVDEECQIFTEKSGDVVCWNSDRTISFDGYYDQEKNQYQIHNSDNNIYVLSYEKTNSEDKNSVQTLITSEDNCFGNTNREQKLESDKAVDYFKNVGKIRNYFNETFSNEADEILFCYYDDSFDSGNNGYASWGYSDGTVIEASKEVGIISIGYNKDLNQIDLLAHEYMHRVEQNLSRLSYEGESGAIMEAYSDIFGEILEAKLNNSAPDWIHNSIRNIIDPSENKLPSKYKGKYWEKTSNLNNDYGGVHYNNTVLSHAAYLMWNGIDGNSSKKIDTDTLAEIWFRALNLLRYKDDFQKCANAVYKSAKCCRNITDEQLKCVEEAFAAVDLNVQKENVLTAEKGAYLFVNDINFEHYDNYHLKIDEIISLSNGVKRNSTPKTVVDTDVTDAYGYILNIDAGVYKITVKDNDINNTSGKEYSIILNVRESGLSEFYKTVTIDTDFGSTNITDFTVPADIVLTLGETNVIEPETSPANAVGYSLKWSSSDESVVSVNPSGETGTLMSKSKGTAVITAELNSNGKTISKSTTVRVATQGRDTVLVLDVSGSMSGTPIDEMKKSAINFCNELLADEYNNRVGLILYDSDIYKIDLTNDLNYLISYIESIDSGSTTNMQGALAAAEEMLDNQGKSENIKNVVIMADGLPNEGETSDTGEMSQFTQYSNYPTDVAYANGVINQAESIMSKYNMYSLGFFHDLYDLEKDFATDLMKLLTNMSDGYHQVDTAENLQFAFGDIQETISDGSKIVINIACPVDVNVSYNGETLSSAADTYCDTASFGALQLLGKDKDIKVLSLNPGINYDVDLVGTGTGTMDYYINYIDETDNMVDYRNFESVPITPTTRINSNTDNTGDSIELNIDKDGDGEIDEIWSATVKGTATVSYSNENQEPATEEPVVENPVDESDNSWQTVLIVVLVVVVFGGVIFAVVFLSSTSNKKNSKINIPVANNTIDDKNYRQTESLNNNGKICIVNGPMNGKIFELDNEKDYTLGRDNNAQIVLSSDYSKVGRLHCIIMFDSNENCYYVTDLSTNGTFLSNGQRLAKDKKVKISRETTLTLADNDCKISLL